MTVEPTSRQAEPAAIGARLRRLSERIDREANAIYAAMGVAFEQRWYGVLSLLVERGPLSVGEMARHLGVSHVAVSQVRASLADAGLIAATDDAADKRRRVLDLTAAGREMTRRLAPLWEALNLAGAALNREAGDPAAALDRLEAALDRESLSFRVQAALADAPSARRL